MDTSLSTTMTSQLPDVDLTKIPSPCFILDEKLLIKNLQILEGLQKQADIKILCAFKGYAMWSTFPLLRKFLAGATASSLHEAQLCQDEFGKKAHLCAPAYSSKEIETLTDISSHITFNSLDQYHRFSTIADKKGLKIGLRINPEYSEVTPEIYNPCIPGSRLGITKENMPSKLPQFVSGLHFHSLCEQNAGALVRTLEVIEKNFQNHLHHASWLNIGGGHHFTRDDYDRELFVRTIRSLKAKYNLEIIAEPGEAIGWKTGYLLATVLDIVEANSIHTAMLDVSFAAHMPDCLEMPYQPDIYGTVEPGSTTYKYRLGGNTCLAGDFMDNYHFSQALKAGDHILFDDMIHYTMVKTNTFNGVQLPSIGILKKDGTFELMRKFDYTDYKNRLS